MLLAAVAWWGLAYAFELTATDIATKSRWGDLKYVGIAVLAPAWLVFVLEYTNRGHLVTRRLLVLLAIEPLLLMVCLFVPATHDLVRFYPADAAGVDLPVVGTGPVFWVHLAYSNLMILAATWLFVVSMVRLSGTYRRMALVLVAAALLPWVANLLHNFDVGWFATHRPDPVRVHPDRLCARLGTVPGATDPPDAAGARGDRGEHERQRLRARCLRSGDRRQPSRHPAARHLTPPAGGSLSRRCARWRRW